MIRMLTALLIACLPAVVGGFEIEPLPALVPDRHAAEPAVVADGRGGFLLSWQSRLGEGLSALRFRPVDADGRAGTIGEISRGVGWFTNWADFPAMAVLDNGDWLAHWLQRSGAGRYAYHVHLVRSHDRGATWSAPEVVHDDLSASEHGFVAYAPVVGDVARVIWLDGRHTAAAAHAHGHAAAADGSMPGHGHGHGNGGAAMTLRATRVDRAGIGPSEELDDSVCDCCQTDAVRFGEQTLVVYRARRPGEVRDVRLVRHDGKRWLPSQALFTDGWVMPGCPVNGPAIAARGRAVAAASFSAAGGRASVSVRTSSDGGRQWQPPVTVAEDDSLGRLDLAALPGGLFVLAHQVATGSDAELRLLLFDQQGQPLREATLATLPAGRLTGFPRLAAVDGRVLVAWTEPVDGAPRVRAALVRIAPDH